MFQTLLLEITRKRTSSTGSISVEQPRGKVTRAPAIIPSYPVDEAAKSPEGNCYLLQ